jgi:catechol 2,3-dioxygenase-like lactoylglutathione lyase family enzyme
MDTMKSAERVERRHGQAGGGLRRADHVGITVSSMPQALDFWIGVLGFRLLDQTHYENSPFLENVVGVPGADATLAMIEGPDGHLVELLEYHAPADRQVMKPRSCDIGSVHLAYMVDDMDALLQRVESRGWHPVGMVQTVAGGPRDGLRIAYVRGPDGVTLEFLQAPSSPGGLAANWPNSLGAVPGAIG